MGTIQYSDERDKTLFSNASLAIGKLITGSNNQQGLDALKKIFLKHVESVTFTPFNERERKDLGNTSTIGSIRINCIGLHGATTLNQYRKVKHTIFHELLHAHVAAIIDIT